MSGNGRARTRTFTAHTQAGDVQVKSYFETIAELFALCGCGPRRDKTEYERLLEDEEDETRRKLTQSHLLLRWVALLLSGEYLPDNQQIYAGLFRVAGVLDGLAQSEPLASDDTQLSDGTTRVLNETQGLLKDVARWFTSDDAQIGSETRIPNGNSRHQLQRVVFHARQLVRGGAPPPPDVADTAKDLVPELETVQRSAEQAAEDLRLALYSFAQVGITLVTCNQLLDAIRDAVNFARDVVADTAHSAAEGVAGVETAVRPDEHEREAPGKEQAVEVKAGASAQANEVANAAQDAVAQVAQLSAINVDAATEQVKQVPEDLKNRASEKLPSADSFLDRFLNVVQELIAEDEDFRTAVQGLLGLARKYAGALKTATEGAVPEELIVEAGRGEDDNGQPPPSLLERNPDLAHLLRAGRELLEGLAGGKSLEPIIEECSAVWEQVRDDVLRAYSDWLDDASRALAEDDSADAAEKAHKLAQTLRDAIENVRKSLQTREDLREREEKIQRLVQSFVSEITRKARIRTMGRRIAAITSVVRTTFDAQTRAITRQGYELLNDTWNKILPSLLTILGSIPLPRIEFTSPQFDAALDDLSLAAIHLIPARVRVEASEVVEWDGSQPTTTQSSVSGGLRQLRIQASGLRLAVRDVSFFVREKVTQTSAHWLNALCCALPGRREKYTLAGREETGHLGAYREAGLLDLGLFGEGDEGARVDVEVEQRRRRQHDDDDANTHPGFSGKRTTHIDLSSSFSLRLRKTHHSIINTLLVQPILAPTTRLVLQSVGESLLSDGLAKMDNAVWDLHSRAARLSGPGNSPGVTHYVRVLMDRNAGKSARRLERERREEKEAEQRERERERVERERQEEGDDEDAAGPSQPKIEVKPMVSGVTTATMTTKMLGPSCPRQTLITIAAPHPPRQSSSTQPRPSPCPSARTPRCSRRTPRAAPLAAWPHATPSCRTSGAAWSPNAQTRRSLSSPRVRAGSAIWRRAQKTPSRALHVGLARCANWLDASRTVLSTGAKSTRRCGKMSSTKVMQAPNGRRRITGSGRISLGTTTALICPNKHAVGKLLYYGTIQLQRQEGFHATSSPHGSRNSTCELQLEGHPTQLPLQRLAMLSRLFDARRSGGGVVAILFRVLGMIVVIAAVFDLDISQLLDDVAEEDPCSVGLTAHEILSDVDAQQR